MAKFAEHKANVFSVMGVKAHLDEEEGALSAARLRGVQYVGRLGAAGKA